MEWVETTGTTIEQAKELALDQLGVDSGDAEFEVLEEPKVGLFGRTRGSARVRARVSPKAPRPKTERRPRRSKRSEGGGTSDAAPARGNDDASDRGSKGRSNGRGGEAKPARQESQESQDAREPKRRAERPEKVRQDREPMDVEEQKQVLTAFLEGLGTSFGLELSAEATSEDDEVRVNMKGEGLGVLVGPRLATLDAIQEISRNALQRQADGREYARVIVDVQDIRQRRKDALTEFVNDAARQVLDDEVTVVFEVMSSADRKIVHDVASSLDGVESASEGEDPRRRVVLRKA